jgi:hypothetical protein
MPVLIGLKGIIAKEIEGEFIETASRLPRILSKNIAATAAGAHGAINVWKDDCGNIRCDAMRYRISVETQTYETIEDAVEWVKRWLKKIK